MNIYIPTLGRIEKQLTWERIPAKLRERTFLVCPPTEAAAHRERGRNALVCAAKGIAHVRQWLVERGEPKICMVDDDHYFVRRTSPASPRLRVCSSEDVEEMFLRLEQLLESYPMVGVSARQGNDTFLGRGVRENQEVRPGLAENCRLCNLYGVRTDVLQELGIRFNTVELMEDMHVVLSLLENHRKTACITEFAWNQSGSGKEGGCSQYRDASRQKEAALKMEQLHYPWVVVVRKFSKSSWESVGAVRYDVRVNWKAAAASRKSPARPVKLL